jgi:hypothetical protein
MLEPPMAKPIAREGVLGIQVRSPDNRWIDLPYRFFYGGDRVVAGGKTVRSYADRDEAARVANETIKRLQVQNPGGAYQVVRPPEGQVESGLVWVPLSRNRLG